VIIQGHYRNINSLAPYTDEWATQFAKLEAYKREHDDCAVPQKWAEDPVLGIWVRTQRTNKRNLDAGKPTPGTTAQRTAQLTALGFDWGKRSAHKRSKK
jgi:hypothetical protein